MLGLLYHVTKGLLGGESMKYQLNAVVTGGRKIFRNFLITPIPPHNIQSCYRPWQMKEKRRMGIVQRKRFLKWHFSLVKTNVYIHHDCVCMHKCIWNEQSVPSHILVHSPANLLKTLNWKYKPLFCTTAGIQMATSLCYICKNAVHNQTNSWVLVNAQHMFHKVFERSSTKQTSQSVWACIASTIRRPSAAFPKLFCSQVPFGFKI